MILLTCLLSDFSAAARRFVFANAAEGGSASAEASADRVGEILQSSAAEIHQTERRAAGAAHKKLFSKKVRAKFSIFYQRQTIFNEVK